LFSPSKEQKNEHTKQMKHLQCQWEGIAKAAKMSALLGLPDDKELKQEKMRKVETTKSF
jgi:hypothetical protein